MPWVF